MSNRNRKFRRLLVETLESRELLSANATFDPSPEELELLERINRMRIDPQGELARIFSDLENGIANDSRITSYFNAYAYPSLARLQREFASLTAAAPLAWDNTLASVADAHTTLMISRKTQAHTLPGEQSLEARLIASGFYDPESGLKLDYAENITAFGFSPVEGEYGSVASYIHEFLVIDFGNSNHEHRNNVMDPNLSLVGIGLQQVPEGTTGFGPWVVTVDFASTSNGAALPEGGYLLGVAYDDANANQMYEAGEGLGDMQIVVRQGGSVVADFSTTSAGAYQQYLENGTYTVTITGSAFAVPMTQTVVIDGQNVKADFRPQDAATQTPVVDLNGTDSGVNFNVAFPETSQPSSIVSTGLTVTSGSWLTYAVVQLHDQPDGNYEMLQVDVGGTSLSARYDSATGTLTISGTATAEDYAKVLQTLSYRNNLDRPHLETRTVSVIVSNGYKESTAAVSSVKMTAVYVPEMTINDVKVIEGDEGVTDLVFTVELSEMPREMIVVNYAISAGTAEAGVDFTPTTGRVVINAWDRTTATITVSINADYDPGENRTVLLDVLSATNVTLLREQAVGTILEDDVVTHLGRMPTWSDGNLEFIDGVRLLYSFEAMYDGQVSWDTVLDSLPEGTRMVVYESTHSSIAFAYSTLSADKQHLEFDVTEGTTYVVKIELRDELAEELRPGIVSTKMAQTVRIIDDGIEILGNTDQPTEFVVDFTDGELRVGYDDALTRLDPSLYYMIQFGLLGVGDGVTIVGGGSQDDPIVSRPDDEFLVVNGVTINIGGFEKITFAGTDAYDSVQIVADGNDSQFTFEDGNTTLVTATKVYYTYQVESVLVTATGSGGNAAFYDLPSNDTYTLQSDNILFEGGGFRIETQGFQKGNVFPISGGNDTTLIYGQNDSRIVFAGNVVDRIDATSSYRVWNPKTVTATNKDDSNNTVTFYNVNPGDQYYVALSCLTATNRQQSVHYQAIGFNDVSIRTLGNGSGSATIYMTSDARIEWQNNQAVLTNDLQKVVLPSGATYQFQSALQTQTALSATTTETYVATTDTASLSLTTESVSDLSAASDAAVSAFTEESVDDLLLQSLAWEQEQKSRTTDQDETDDETDLLRVFARRVALLSLR